MPSKVYWTTTTLARVIKHLADLQFVGKTNSQKKRQCHSDRNEDRVKKTAKFVVRTHPTLYTTVEGLVGAL